MVSRKFFILFSIFISLVGNKALAYDIEVENADGIVIMYDYSQDGLELIVRGIRKSSDNYSGSLVIPEEVTYMNRTRKVTMIANSAFQYYRGLTNIALPNCLKSIGEKAFSNCESLTSIAIPTSLTSIGKYAFENCKGLKKVIIKDIAAWCNVEIPNQYSNAYGTDANPLAYAGHLYSDDNTEIKQLVIPDGVKKIGDFAFNGCTYLTSVTIPNSVTSIGTGAFYYCGGLTSLFIPNGVTNIGNVAFTGCRSLSSLEIPNSVTTIEFGAFKDCSSLTSIIIPSSVTSIGRNAFKNIPLTTVISRITKPNEIYGKHSKDLEMTFDLDTYNNATLYVPKGTVDVYKGTYGWKDFLFIEEENSITPDNKKCKTPNITYKDGKIVFLCETEGAICYSTITDTDITSYASNEVQLTATYNISVYATKEGYDNSDVATATLCWIDVEPKKEGITNGVANVRANAVIIKAEGSLLTIEGVDDNSIISVYTLNGIQIGSAVSKNSVATVNTNLSHNSIAVVKIGNKSVKVAIK